MSNYQKGFTMLELIISMALGLLIIAAATGVFLAGQRSLATQTGASDLQQNAIFGIAQLTHDLRHINLNTTSTTTIKIDDPGAGIVFSDKNFAGIQNVHVTKTVDPSKVNDKAVFVGLNNDQLTIQFKPHVANLLQSCVGTPLKANEINVQRYFIQPMPQGNGRFGLYCDANNDTDKFGNPRLMIPDVEAFKVRFGTKNGNNMQYKGIGTLTATDQLISIEVGLIMRSTHNLGSSNSVVNDEKTYRIAGQEVKLTDTSGTPAFMREVFSQVVAIRNSSGG
ncbi:PilW family protein [Moraxella oblonga]|uniref:PilW family protein n=1 Tax=Moraxella oblonga TaxID=200413 RepID=UPI00082F0043|nr:PilW family protein [Moraxella oblonga]